MRKRILNCTGLPVILSIGSTKILANHYVKKRPVPSNQKLEKTYSELPNDEHPKRTRSGLHNKTAVLSGIV